MGKIVKFEKGGEFRYWDMDEDVQATQEAYEAQKRGDPIPVYSEEGQLLRTEPGRISREEARRLGRTVTELEASGVPRQEALMRAGGVPKPDKGFVEKTGGALTAAGRGFKTGIGGMLALPAVAAHGLGKAVGHKPWELAAKESMAETYREWNPPETIRSQEEYPTAAFAGEWAPTLVNPSAKAITKKLGRDQATHMARAAKRTLPAVRGPYRTAMRQTASELDALKKAQINAERDLAMRKTLAAMESGEAFKSPGFRDLLAEGRKTARQTRHGREAELSQARARLEKARVESQHAGSSQAAGAEKLQRTIDEMPRVADPASVKEASLRDMLAKVEAKFGERGAEAAGRYRVRMAGEGGVGAGRRKSLKKAEAALDVARQKAAAKKSAGTDLAVKDAEAAYQHQVGLLQAERFRLAEMDVSAMTKAEASRVAKAKAAIDLELAESMMRTAEASTRQQRRKAVREGSQRLLEGSGATKGRSGALASAKAVRDAELAAAKSKVALEKFERSRRGIVRDHLRALGLGSKKLRPGALPTKASDSAAGAIGGGAAALTGTPAFTGITLGRLGHLLANRGGPALRRIVLGGLEKSTAMSYPTRLGRMPGPGVPYLLGEFASESDYMEALEKAIAADPEASAELAQLRIEGGLE